MSRIGAVALLIARASEYRSNSYRIGSGPPACGLGQRNRSSLSPICVVFDVRDMRLRIRTLSGRGAENPGGESRQQDAHGDAAHSFLGTGHPQFGALLREGDGPDLGRARSWRNRSPAPRCSICLDTHPILLGNGHSLKPLDDRRARSSWKISIGCGFHTWALWACVGAAFGPDGSQSKQLSTSEPDGISTAVSPLPPSYWPAHAVA